MNGNVRRFDIPTKVWSFLAPFYLCKNPLQSSPTITTVILDRSKGFIVRAIRITLQLFRGWNSQWKLQRSIWALAIPPNAIVRVFILLS